MANTKSKADVMESISLARTRLLSQCPFFGYLAMQLRPLLATPEHNVPTAGVSIDGTLIVNADFVATLSPKEFAGVIAHEVLHPALWFWARKGGRNHQLFNIAHDLSLNPMITEMGKAEIALPKGALLDEKFAGMSAEEIYAYLQKGDPQTPGQTTVACHGGGSITVDTNGAGGEDYQDCMDALNSTKTGQDAARGDKSAANKLANEWKLALAGAAQQHLKSQTQGKLPAELQRYLDQLLHPKLDWIELLTRWVGENGQREDYSFARPNRRSSAIGTYLPSLTAASMADVTVLIDTSGSIPQERLKRVLGEIAGICDQMGSEIRVIIVDATVHDDLTVEDAMEVAVKLKGGGGSDFSPAFDRLVEEGFDAAVIAFTDGLISVPDTMPNDVKGVLWVTDENEKPPAGCTWGDHVTVSDKDVTTTDAGK